MATRKAKTTKSTTPSKTTRSTKITTAAAKTTAPKKTTPKVEKKTTPDKKVEEETKSTQVQSPRRVPSFSIKRSYLIIGLVVIALLGLAYFYRSLFIVATVNGEPISRLTYIQELERMSGQQAMNALVTKTLILQEASEQNVTVGDEEVDQEISEIEENLQSQGQDLDSVLTLQGLTREALREQIYLQKLIEKMVGENVQVSDEEVATYIENNQETLPEDQSEEEQQQAVRDQLRQQKLNEEVQTWLQELQQNADINYLVTQQ